MALRQFTCFLILAIACLSFALAQPGGNAESGCHALLTRKSRFMGVEACATAAVRSKKILGRKMVTKLDKQEGYHATGHMPRSAQASLENYVKLEGRRALHVGRKFKVNPFPDQEFDDDDRGFVAFNADYHAPRHHPPTHN